MIDQNQQNNPEQQAPEGPKWESDWDVQPLSVTGGLPTIQRGLHEGREKKWDAVKNMEVVGLKPAEWGDGVLFFDHESNEWALGTMEASLAMQQSMQASYERGIFARNSANDVYDAQMATAGRDKNVYDDTILDFTPEEEVLLDEWANNTSKWNIIAATQGLRAAPFAEFAYDTPDALFKKDAVPGWNLKTALTLLEQKQPDYYQRYAIALGGEDAVKEAVAGAETAPEFFFKLNNSVQQRAHAESMTRFSEKAGWLEKGWTHSYNFVVNGIVNDPDMVASLAISAALNAVSGGTLGTALMTAKLTKNAATATTSLRGLGVIKGMSKITHLSRGAMNWLPERIGPHLLEKFVFKDTTKTGLVKFLANRTSDATEGLITGGLAEYMNQRSQVDTGKRGAIAWSEIWTEAKWEAAFSPLINPVMGRLMVLPSIGAQYGFKHININMGEKLVGKRAYGLIKNAFDNPEYSPEIFELMRNEVGLRKMVAKKTGKTYQDVDIEANEQFGRILGLIAARAKTKDGQPIPPDRLLANVNDAMSIIDQNHPGELSDVQLADLLVDSYATSHDLGTNEEVAAIKDGISIQLAIDEARARHNAEIQTEIDKVGPNTDEGKALHASKLDHGQYIDHITTTGDYLDVLPPEAIRKAKENWKKEKGNEKREWDAITPEEQFQAVADYQRGVLEAQDAEISGWKAEQKKLLGIIQQASDKLAKVMGEETDSEKKKTRRKRRTAAETEAKKAALKTEHAARESEVKSLEEAELPDSEAIDKAKAALASIEQQIKDFNAAEVQRRKREREDSKVTDEETKAKLRGIIKELLDADATDPDSLHGSWDPDTVVELMEARLTAKREVLREMEIEQATLLAIIDMINSSEGGSFALENTAYETHEDLISAGQALEIPGSEDWNADDGMSFNDRLLLVHIAEEDIELSSEVKALSGASSWYSLMQRKFNTSAGPLPISTILITKDNSNLAGEHENLGALLDGGLDGTDLPSSLLETVVTIETDNGPIEILVQDLLIAADGIYTTLTKDQALDADWWTTEEGIEEAITIIAATTGLETEAGADVDNIASIQNVVISTNLDVDVGVVTIGDIEALYRNDTDVSAENRDKLSDSDPDHQPAQIQAFWESPDGIATATTLIENATGIETTSEVEGSIEAEVEAEFNKEEPETDDTPEGESKDPATSLDTETEDTSEMSEEEIFKARKERAEQRRNELKAALDGAKEAGDPSKVTDLEEDITQLDYAIEEFSRALTNMDDSAAAAAESFGADPELNNLVSELSNLQRELVALDKASRDKYKKLLDHLDKRASETVSTIAGTIGLDDAGRKKAVAESSNLTDAEREDIKAWADDIETKGSFDFVTEDGYWKKRIKKFVTKPGDTMSSKELKQFISWLSESYTPRRMKEFENSSERQAWKSKLREKNKVAQKWALERNKMWVRRMKNNRKIYFTIETFREVLQERKRILDDLEHVYVKSFKALIESKKAAGDLKVGWETLSIVLPPNTMIFTHHNEINKAQAKDGSGYKSYTLAEAQTIMDTAREEIESYVKALRPGWLQYKISPGSMEAIGATYAHEVDNDYALELEYTPDEILEKADKDHKEIDYMSRDLEAEATALGDWYNQLQLFEVSEGRQVDGETLVSAFKVMSVMPDFFHDLGVGLHVFLKDAVFDNESGLSSRSEDITLLLNMDKVSFRLDKVLDIVAVQMQRSKIGLGQWHESLVNAGITQQINAITEEGTAGSQYNLIVTESVLGKIQEAMAVINKQLFDDYGFLMDEDANGMPILFTPNKTEGVDTADTQQTRDPAKFKAKAIRFAKSRIRTLLKGDTPGWYKNLQYVLDTYPEKFGLSNYEEGTTSAAIALDVEQKLWTFIETNFDAIFDGITIESLGDGTVDYVTAKKAGEALIDIFFNKDLVVKSPLTGLDPTFAMTDNVNEVEINKGEPVATRLPLEGESNRAAALTTRELFSNLEEHRHRRRIKAILDMKDLDTSQEGEIWQWVRTAKEQHSPTPTGIKMRFGVLPQVVGGNLSERSIDIADLKDWYKEILLDLPHVAAVHLHDEVTLEQGSYIEMADGRQVYLDELSAGSSALVPFGRIGENLAIEALWAGYDGYTEATVRAVTRIHDENRAAGRPDAELFSPKHWKDRTFSGLVEIKLLAMAGNGDRKGVKKIIEKLTNSTLAELFADSEIDVTGTPLDYYKKAGLYVAENLHTRVKKGANAGDSQLKVWDKVMSVLRKDGTDSFMTMEEWDARIEEVGETSPEGKKLVALRGLFKIPVMRRLYQGGLPSFTKEFGNGRYSQSRNEKLATAEGVKALQKLESAFKEDLGEAFLSDENVNAFGEFLYSQSVDQMALIIDAALGLGGEARADAIAFLRTDIKGGSAASKTEIMLDKVIAMSQGNKTELSDNHPLKNMQAHEEMFDAVIDDLTTKEYGYSDTEQWEKDRTKIEEKYGPRWEEARTFLRTLTPEQWKTFEPGTEEWGEYQSILHGSEMLFKSLGYFRALNIMNSSAHTMNVDRMEKMAEFVGFKDFDRNDFLGLETYLLFHTHRPTTGSARTYNKLAGYGMNTQGSFWERVAKNPNIVDPSNEVDSIWAVEAKKLGVAIGDLSMKQRSKILGQYMMIDKDNRDAMGMYDIVNNPFKTQEDGTGMTPEAFDAMIDELLLKNILMQMSEFDTPEKIGYDEENNDRAMTSDGLQQWVDHTISRIPTLSEEIAWEEELLDLTDDTTITEEERNAHLETLAIRSATGRVLSPRVARALGTPLESFGNGESKFATVYGKKGGKALTKNTGNLVGPLSMMPAYKRSSYFDKGIPALQRLKIRRDLSKVLGERRSPGKIAFADPNMAFMPAEATGHMSPWKKSSLPLPMPMHTTYTETLGANNETGRRAVQVHMSLDHWAARKGLTQQLADNPDNLPYFFNLMKVDMLREKIIRDMRTRSARNAGTSEEDMASEISHERLRWLIEMHSYTYLSHDLKNAKTSGMTVDAPGRSLVTVRGDFGTASQKEILTNVLTPENPDGYLLDETLLHEQLLYGLVPREGITIQGVDIADSDKFFYEDLQLVSSVIQAHDFNKFMLATLYTTYIGEILDTFGDGKYKDKTFVNKRGEEVKVAHDPDSWQTVIEPDDQIEIIQMVKIKADREGGINIDLEMIPEMIGGIINRDEDGNVRYVSDLQQATVMRKVAGSREPVEVSLRNALTSQGFGILVNAPRQVKGKNIKLALTLDASTFLFSLFENADALSVLQLSHLAKTNIGTKKVGGKWMRAKTNSRMASEALDFNMDDANHQAVVDSDVLKKIGRVLNPDMELPTVAHDSAGKGQGGMDVVDLDLFRDTTVGGMTHIGVQTHINAINQRVGRIKRGNLQLNDHDTLTEVQMWINDTIAMESHSYQARAVVTYLGLMLETGTHAPGTLLEGMFIERTSFPVDDVTFRRERDSARREAVTLFHKLTAMTHMDKGISNNPYGGRAVEYFWKEDVGPKSDDESVQEHFLNTIMASEIRHPGLLGLTEGEQTAKKRRWATEAFELGRVDNAYNEANSNSEWFGSLADRKFDTMEVAKSSSAFANFAKERGDIHLERLNGAIDAMTETKSGGQNFLRSKDAKVIRAMVLRMYTYNPLSIRDLRFDYGKIMTELGSAQREGSSYQLGLNTNMKGKHHRAVTIIAHELAHLATFKFLESGSSDMKRWQWLYHDSPKAKDFLHKMVVSWEGGVETKETRALAAYYMSNQEEFMAAMVQYHLLNEVRDIVAPENFTTEDIAKRNKVGQLVEQIMQYVQKTFGRLHAVFSNFEKTDPYLFNQINQMSQRLLGWDSEGQRAFMETGKPAFTGKAKHAAIYDEGDNTSKMSDEEFTKLALQEQELTNKADRTDKEVEHLRQLRKTLLDNEISDMTGISRKTFAQRAPKVIGKWHADNNPGILDLKKMNRATRVEFEEQQVALAIVMKAVRDVLGDPVTDNAGEMSRAGLSKLSTMLGMEEGRLQEWLVNLTVGSTGAHRTYMGGTMFQMLFSALLDDRILMTANGISNLKGMPSVTRSLEELNVVTDNMAGFNADLVKLIGSPSRKGELHKKLHNQLIHLVDDKDYTLVIPSDVAAGDVDAVTTILKDSAMSMRNFLDDLVKRGTEIGLYKGGFTSLVPYRLNESFAHDEGTNSTFKEAMHAEILERITAPTGELAKKIDPISLYAAGAVPSVGGAEKMSRDIRRIGGLDSSGNLTNLKKGSETDEGKILIYLAKRSLERLDPQFAELATDTQRTKAVAMLSQSLVDNKGELSAVAERYQDALSSEIISLMNAMSLGHMQWSHLGTAAGIASGRNNKLRVKLQETAGMKDNEANSESVARIAARLGELNNPGLDIPSHIFYRPSEDARTTHPDPIKSVADVHYFNLINKASVGLYFPNNSWIIPKFHEIADNPAIAGALVTDPEFLVGQFKKSVGDNVIEVKMMRDNFGVHGDYGDLISLSRAVFRQERGKQADGTDMSDEDRQNLLLGMDALEGKWNFVRGITRSVSPTDSLSEAFYDIAPALTKIAFGGNLALASGTVEGIFNALTEAVGRKSLTGFTRAAMFPFLNLKPDIRRRVARDLVHTIQAVTKGYVPEFERPSTAIEKNAVTKLVQAWGSTMMKPSQYVISGIAVSRAITARTVVSEHLKSGALLDLQAALIEGNVATDAGLLGAMREANIPKTDLMLVKQMIQAGILEPGVFDNMKNMFDKAYDGKEFKDGYYSLGELMQWMNTKTESKSDEYRESMDVITRLRGLEKAYIEEVLISPNAFDIHTGGGKKGSTGVWDTIFEIFRRYPVLFVSQKVIRASGNKSPAAWGFSLLGMALLDILYMMSLRLAAGAAPGEIIEEFDENPTGFVMNYVTRLPLFGRYLPMIFDLVKEIAGARAGQGSPFIPLSALVSAVKGPVKVGTGMANGTLTGSDLMNAMRVLPYVGDSIIRGALNLGAQDLMSRNLMASTPHSQAKAQFQSGGGHFGVPKEARDFNYESMLGNMYKEAFGMPKNTSRKNTNVYKDLTQPTATPQPSQPTQQAAMPAAGGGVAPQAPHPMTQLAKAKGSSGKLADRLS